MSSLLRWIGVGKDSQAKETPEPVHNFITGISVISGPVPPTEAAVDVVFLHGITGNRERTWTAENAESPWPGRFLPPAPPLARIILFGYDARVAHWQDMVAQGGISSHAKSLLNTLGNFRDADGSNARPIIFVVHSMGGLVCEDALLLSKDTPESHLRAILSNTKAIAFLGTPHAGAGALAEWAGHLAKFIGLVSRVNKKLLESLETDSEVLARIEEGFHTMIRARQREGQPGIQMTCFFEQIPLRGICYVVRPQSAILPAYTSVPLNKSHITMTKFEVKNDPDYLAVVGELRRWYREIIDRQGDQTTKKPPAIRNPRNHEEIIARQYATELQLMYDEDLDLYSLAVPYRLLPSDESQSFNFPPPSEIETIEGPSQWQRILRLFQPRKEQMLDDARLRRRALPLVPWLSNTFLALVRTSDLFRILASSVSERQKGPRVVLVHNIKFSVLNTLYQNIPVVIPTYYNDSGHYLSFTTVAGREYGDAFTGAGSLAPDLPYRINFICSKPGYEKVQRPSLLALYQISRQTNVLFRSQVHKCFALWQHFAILLDDAWDHDDAYECTEEQIPIKKHVESYRAFTERQRPLHNEIWDRHTVAVGVLQRQCSAYFTRTENLHLTFENEDLVKRLSTVDQALQLKAKCQLEGDDTTAPTTSTSNADSLAYDLCLDFNISAASADSGTNDSSDNANILEEWYAQWGFEGTRWLLIALTTTLGHNFSSVQALPESFEVLLQSPNCYIA